MVFDIDAHNKKVQEILRKHYKSLDHDLYKKVIDITIQVVKSGDLIQEVHMYNDMKRYDYKPYREKEVLLEKIDKLEKQLNIASKALGKYGKFENLIQITKGLTTHTRHKDDIETIEDCGYVLKLKGKIARKALKEMGVKL